MTRKNGDHNRIINHLIGYGIALLLDLISAVIVSIFIYNEYFTMQQTQPVVFITHMLASFCSVKFVLNRVGDRKILNAAIIAGAYYLTQIIASILLFDSLIGSIFTSLIPILAGATGAVLLGEKVKKRSKRRKIR